jgi:hypothetical protein
MSRVPNTMALIAEPERDGRAVRCPAITHWALRAPYNLPKTPRTSLSVVMGCSDVRQKGEARCEAAGQRHSEGDNERSQVVNSQMLHNRLAS